MRILLYLHTLDIEVLLMFHRHPATTHRLDIALSMLQTITCTQCMQTEHLNIQEWSYGLSVKHSCQQAALPVCCHTACMGNTCLPSRCFLAITACLQQSISCLYPLVLLFNTHMHSSKI